MSKTRFQHEGGDPRNASGAHWTAPAPLRLRAGVHCGEAVVTRDDVIGHVVNVAARVTEAARGGEVLATGAAVEAAGSLRGVEVSRGRRRTFKGLDEPVRVHRVTATVG